MSLPAHKLRVLLAGCLKELSLLVSPSEDGQRVRMSPVLFSRAEPASSVNVYLERIQSA